jgi:hypothetical protein
MRMKVHSSLVIGAAATASLLAASSAMGASIGVNFSGGGGGPGNDAADQRDLLPTQAAGVVPSTNWNNATGFNATLPALLSDAGPTAASVTWATNGVWTAHDTPVGSDPNQVLMNGYIDDTTAAPDPPTTISFSNLPFIGPYDVYVYYGSDGNDRTGTITASNSPTVYNIATNSNPFDGEFTLATPEDDAAVDNGEYALFSGVTGNALTITATRVSNNIGVHGVQLVGTIPEPASLGLLGVGALGLLARRRRRA